MGRQRARSYQMPVRSKGLGSGVAMFAQTSIWARLASHIVLDDYMGGGVLLLGYNPRHTSGDEDGNLHSR